MKYVWAAASHVGLVRTANEDSVYPATGGSGPGPLLVAVADGMGGHVAGEVASRIAITTATTDPDELEPPPSARVVAANEAVFSAVAANPDLAGMGTTLTLARLDEAGAMTIAHVGDSRCYLLRAGELRQLTDDHTLVAQLVADGRITADEAHDHPQRHYLTRALGTDPAVAVDELHEDIEPSDRVLLCTDGLNGMVRDDALRAILAAGAAPEDTVWRLVEAANQAGGQDNTTVIVVDALP